MGKLDFMTKIDRKSIGLRDDPDPGEFLRQMTADLPLFVSLRGQSFVGLPDGEPRKLFRETNKAWVDAPGSPRFLKDGSFLLKSPNTSSPRC